MEPGCRRDLPAGPRCAAGQGEDRRTSGARPVRRRGCGRTVRRFKALVAGYDVVVVQGGFVEAGADDENAVEGRLDGDLVLVAGEAEAIVGDLGGEVLADLVAVDHPTDAQCVLVFATQRPALAPGRLRDGGESVSLAAIRAWRIVGPFVGQGGCGSGSGARRGSAGG